MPALKALAFQPEAEGELAGQVGVEADVGVEVGLEDRLRVVGGDLLDLHAAELGGHHHREALRRGRARCPR